MLLYRVSELAISISFKHAEQPLPANYAKPFNGFNNFNRSKRTIYYAQE